MRYQPTASPSKNRDLKALSLTVMLLASSLAGPWFFADPGTAIATDWRFDQDGNDIDDRLDSRMDGGDPGPWVVELHYSRPPTSTDETLLETQFGAERLYRMQNWNSILAEVDASNVQGIANLLEVYGVEQLPEMELDDEIEVEHSRKTTRISYANVVDDGYDHRLAVHETLNQTGEGMVVAIMDNGIDNRHLALDDLDDDPATSDPKLVQRMGPFQEPIHAGFDGRFYHAPQSCVDPEGDRHGTAVAGIAVGTAAGTGAPGAAPHAKLVDIAVYIPPHALLAGEWAASFEAGLDFVMSFNRGTSCYGDPMEDKIDVLSISLGWSQSGTPYDALQSKLTDIIRSGVTVVVSAGNSQYPEIFPTISKQVEGAILVGNVNRTDTVGRSDDLLHYTSARGPRRDGHGDTDTDSLDDLMPHVSAPGEGVLAPVPGTLTGYAPFGGTSAAAPHVAGIAALMLQANAGVRPVDGGSLEAMGDAGSVPVRDLLLQSAQYKDGISAKDGQDPVPPQVNATGMFDRPWNNAWGYGFVDAYQATLAAETYVG